jgi:hypothetical protein
MSDLKGSEIKIGDLVVVKILKTDSTLPTRVIGKVSGVRLWSTNEVAVEIEGITAEWFILNDTREIEVI